MRSLHATLVLILGDVVHEQLPPLGVGDVGDVVVEGDAAGVRHVGQRDRADELPGGVEHLQLPVGHAHHRGVACERGTSGGSVIESESGYRTNHLYRVTHQVGKWVGLTLIWDVPPSCLGSR